MRTIMNAQAHAQEITSTQANNNTKEEVNMKVAITRKPITDAQGHFNLDYLEEIRSYKYTLHTAESKVAKLNEEKAILLKEILKRYEDFLGGKTIWLHSEKVDYFNKIKEYNSMIDETIAQEEIIKNAKAKLAEYEY